jgi:hypothetical protein
MIQEATSQRYSAVICKQCREAIPVPSIVLRMESLAISQEDGTQPDRVFNLRCRACEGERPYRSSQIVEIEGEPKTRRSSLKSVYRRGMLTRAAHA